MSKERSLEAGYVTVLLALVCCLIAVVLIVFVESANTVSDREIAQTIADEASLVAVDQINEERFLTSSELALDKAQVRSVVLDIIRSRSRQVEVDLSLARLNISDTQVDLAIAYQSRSTVSFGSVGAQVVSSSARVEVVTS